MNTLFGPLEFTANGQPLEINPVEMPTQYKHFQVDKRYRIDLPNIRRKGEETVLTCRVLPTESCRAGSSTGQDLAQITFRGLGKKMSIGTIGDLPGVEDEYFDYGMQLVISKEAEYTDFLFVVAWCDSNLAETDSTEFLTDPTWGSEQYE